MLQIPGLREYLLESGDKGVAWKVITDHSPEGIDEEQLLWPISKRLVLAPVPVGRGGVGKIVAGVALVAAAIILGPAGALFAAKLDIWHLGRWRSRAFDANAQDAKCQVWRLKLDCGSQRG